MTIKEYLQKVDFLRWSIESKKEKIIALEAIATNTTPSYTGMPHNPSPSQSRMADAVGKKIDVENAIKTDEAALAKLQSEMQEYIEQVKNPQHQIVLLKRYIRGLSVADIADEIGYCRRTTERLLQEANKALNIVLES